MAVPAESAPTASARALRGRCPARHRVHSRNLARAHPRPGREGGIILAFYQTRAPLRIKLYPWHDSVMVLYRDDDQSPHREIDLHGAFHPQTPVLITIASGPGGSSAFLDGVLAGSSPALRLALLDFSGQLVLGSSPIEDDSWIGQVRGLALYGRELSPGEIARHPGAWAQGMDAAGAAREGALAIYTFQERTGDLAHARLDRSPDLYIPRSFQLPHKPLLRIWRSDFRWRGNQQDIIINVVGFMPLGFFLCAYLSSEPSWSRPAFLAVFLGALFSLVIELLQFYVPVRASNVSDIITTPLEPSSAFFSTASCNPYSPQSRSPPGKPNLPRR